jgi:hypothetical protein
VREGNEFGWPRIGSYIRILWTSVSLKEGNFLSRWTEVIGWSTSCTELTYNVDSVVLSFISWESYDVKIHCQSVQMAVANIEYSHTTRNVHSRSPRCSEVEQYTMNAFLHQENMSRCTAALTGNVETTSWGTHSESLADC